MKERLISPDVLEFLDRYERATEQRDPESLGQVFASVFLTLDPRQVGAVTPEQLLAALPHRQQLFARIGASGADLTHITESPLDALHTLVRTTWTLRLEESYGSDRPVTLESSFLLRRRGGGWEIVLYLNHHDVLELVASRSALDES